MQRCNPKKGNTPMQAKLRRARIVFKGLCLETATISPGPRGALRRAAERPIRSEWRPAPVLCERGAPGRGYAGTMGPGEPQETYTVEEAAHRAAVAGDRDAYLEALRGYMRAGRDEALRIRRGAA